MNRAALEGIASRAYFAMLAGTFAQELIRTGRTAKALYFMEGSTENSRSIFVALQQEGYRPNRLPDGSPLPEPPPLDPADLDTPERRALLDALLLAQAAAERVDAQRGRMLPDSIRTNVPETQGTDCAEAVSDLTNRLRLEVFGPRGKE